MDAAQIGVKHREQDILLTGEEVVEATRVDTRRVQNVGDARRAVTFLREEHHRGVDDLVLGVWRHGNQSVERSFNRQGHPTFFAHFRHGSSTARVRMSHRIH